MKNFMLFLILLSGLIVAGCATLTDKPVVVILQNLETMEFVNCKVDNWNMPGSYAENDACVEGYKKKGFVVWGTR
jgi:hypothetical protein